jgi:hypothetical protein
VGRGGCWYIELLVFAIAFAAEGVQFFLGWLDDLAISSAGGSRAVVVSGWERSMAVGTSCLFGVVESRGACVLVDPGATDAAAGISCAFCGVTETLTAWVVAGYGSLFVNSL